MKQILRDAAGAGILLWLVGYLASLILFFTPYAAVMGWVLFAVFTPVTIAVAWWLFRNRDLPLRYYAGVGTAWAGIAVLLDYLFIVLLFSPEAYYQPDVLAYYAAAFLIPVLTGAYVTLGRKR